MELYSCGVDGDTSLLSLLTSLNGARTGIESLEYIWLMPLPCPIQSLFFLTFLQIGMSPLDNISGLCPFLVPFSPYSF